MAQNHSPGSFEETAGPYERWVFSGRLGRPFAFPAIAGAPTGIYTAMLEGGALPASDDKVELRVPPLWSPTKPGAPAAKAKVTPFAFRMKEDPGAEPPSCIATMRGRCHKDSRLRVNFPVDPLSWPTTYATGADPAGWVKRSGVPKAIIAVIDDGLPFANSAFLDADGKTRVSHCWLQAGKADDWAAVPFGKELVNDQIDQLRAAHGTNEPELYRRAGAYSSKIDELGNHLKRASTHGAHVMGLAAGNDTLFPGHLLGDDVQIIAVQLPNTIAWDTSGFGKEMYMLSAIHYVFERAQRIAKAHGVDELPLVLNFSYGWSGGRHDGQSDIELAITDLLNQRRAAQKHSYLVMPMGNNYGSLMHASAGEHVVKDSLTLDWQLPPDDKTATYMEIWFPEGFDPEGYSVSLRGPNAESALSGTIEVTGDPGLTKGDPRRFVDLTWNGQVIGQMSADKHRGNRWRVLIALIPTVYTRGQERRAPAGRWQVKVMRTDAAKALGDEQELLVYVQRDDDPADLKSMGRQSYLMDPDKVYDPSERPQPPIQRITPKLGLVHGYGAMNAVATSPDVTRVAGHIQQNGRPAVYSGAGFLREDKDKNLHPWGIQAGVSAVSDFSRLRPGIPSLGVLSGSRSWLIGTSAASPSVARAMVCNLAAGKDAFDKFDDPLALPKPEDADSIPVGRKHAARVGKQTAPEVPRGGYTPPPVLTS